MTISSKSYQAIMAHLEEKIRAHERSTGIESMLAACDLMEAKADMDDLMITLLDSADAALHYLETPGDFNDEELVHLIEDLDESLRLFETENNA